jgi:outer membrane protein
MALPTRHARAHRAGLALLLLGAAAQAKEAPLWEFGLGIGAIGFNDYRGSDTSHVYPVPIPVGYYNGKFLKADRDGVRGLLFNQEYVEINLSANVTTPVRNDSERSGMPDLRSTLELGPSVDVHLFRSDDRKLKLDLRMPVRAAMTVEGSPKYIGWTFTPRFNLDIADPLGQSDWHLGLLAGPLFADHRYNEYFYDVAPQYATLARSEYRSPGGYAGFQTLAALTKRFPKFWVGAYLRYDNLTGAAFADSPLVRTRSYLTGGFGFAWFIAHSSQLVEIPD